LWGARADNYRIFPDDNPELYIAETNEHLPGELQEDDTRLITAAPQLLEALEYFFNIMHDYQSSVRWQQRIWDAPISASSWTRNTTPSPRGGWRPSKKKLEIPTSMARVCVSTTTGR